MVKFGKNKFKALNKIAKTVKTHITATTETSNKILKKKLNAEKKVSFQKEVLLKEAALGRNSLVKKITPKEILINELGKKTETKKAKEEIYKPNIKAVPKRKKRQKTQINDTKLLLKLMNANK